MSYSLLCPLCLEPSAWFSRSLSEHILNELEFSKGVGGRGSVSDPIIRLSMIKATGPKHDLSR